MDVSYFAIGFGIGLVLLVMTMISRAGLYIPRPWHQGLPFAIMTIGLYIGNNLPPTYEVVLYVICVEVGALMTWAYQVIAGLMYQAYLTGWPRLTKKPQAETQAEPAAQPEPVELGEFRPLVRSVPFEQTIAPPPSFDRERHLAITLVRMYEYDPAQVDLTESKWVKSGKFIRRDFKTVLASWEYHGLIRRRDPGRKNSPFLVADIRRVRMVADGHALPPSPAAYQSQESASPVK